MKAYLVGGAVRDMFLDWNGVSIKDRDYVVVGASVQQMLDNGFNIVGNDFPVFLHPKTREEWALARTERKIGDGYNGFTFDTDNVTLEDDLGRRDLTINAMAYDEENQMVIDPYNGQRDINDKVFRHIDEKRFMEDPVRILRIARFLARMPDFVVAKETTILCEKMVAAGMVDHLTSERIVKEMLRALEEVAPQRFFVFLQMIGALKILFPEVHNLIGKTQPYKHHPEGDAFVHTMLLLENINNPAFTTNGDFNILDKQELTFCALTHDFGKGETKQEDLPHHYGHEQKGVYVIERLEKRLPLPSHLIEKAKIVSRFHTHIHNFDTLRSTTIVDMFDEINVRKNTGIENILPAVSNLDGISRSGFYLNRPYPTRQKAVRVFSELAAVKLSNFFTPDEIKVMGIEKIKNTLHQKKVEVVKKFR